MRVFVQLLMLVMAVGSTASCSMRHYVADDYHQYLINNAGASNIPSTSEVSSYYLPPETQNYSYEFSAGMTGAANIWVVDIGKMLDETLVSPEVQAAFNGLEKKETQESGEGGLLVFELQKYTFENFAAHVYMDVSYIKNGKPVFKNTYVEHGKSQGGKMFWGGAFGQKNAVQQSTKIAIDNILRRLIVDINQE